MAERKSGSELHGVPAPDEMRKARDALRRESREMYDALYREAYQNDGALRQVPFWGMSAGHDTEIAADYAAMRDALINIKRARALKSRRGSPMNIEIMFKAIDELDRAGIPFKVWKGSQAHWHLIEKLGFDDDASDGTEDGAAYSLLRRLGGLARRIGLRG